MTADAHRITAFEMRAKRRQQQLQTKVLLCIGTGRQHLQQFEEVWFGLRQRLTREYLEEIAEVVARMEGDPPHLRQPKSVLSWGMQLALHGLLMKVAPRVTAHRTAGTRCS